jgi:hypothetical protein
MKLYIMLTRVGARRSLPTGSQVFTGGRRFWPWPSKPTVRVRLRCLFLRPCASSVAAPASMDQGNYTDPTEQKPSSVARLVACSICGPGILHPAPPPLAVRLMQEVVMEDNIRTCWQMGKEPAVHVAP